jgi:hypothetical protein
VKLSEELERYKLVLRQLDLSRCHLHELGFMTSSEDVRLEKWIIEERQRVDRMLKAFGIAPTSVPTGIPSLDAARRVNAKAASA